MMQKSWDQTPIAGRGMSPFHMLENGCKRLDAPLHDAECFVGWNLHERGCRRPGRDLVFSLIQIDDDSQVIVDAMGEVEHSQ